MRQISVALFILGVASLACSPAQAAPCPLTIQSLTLAGRGAGGKAVMYSISATIAGPTPTSAILLLHTRKGSTSIAWPNVTPESPPPHERSAIASPSPMPTSSPEATMWFERKAEDTLDVTVLTAGGVACDSPTTPLTTSTTGFPVVSVYDDANHHNSLPERSPLDHVAMITDAAFAKKEPLQYPEMAQDEDISGTVVVGVVIGTDGKASYAWVRARDVSPGGEKLLDGPAIWSALNSTYVPMRADGRPATSMYDIQYVYKLDSPGAGASKPDGIDLYNQCPVVLESLRVSVSDRSDHTQWYTFGVNTKGINRPVSVVIGVRDAQRKTTGFIWNPIPLQQDANYPIWWSAVGSFNWSGPPLTLAWVDQATMRNGTVVNCKPVSDAPFNLADGTEFPRYVAGDPLPLLSVQQVQPARFTREVWPEYPVGKNGARDGGFAVVQTVVDETGTIREAFLTQSSGVRSLDSAALYAATSSDYQSAVPGGVALYEAVYQFVP